MAVALAQHEVHVWYCLTRDPPWSEVLARYLALLAPDERARHDRFLFDKDRRQFLLARVLLRTLLSCYGACPPEAWTFAHSAHGKPRLAEPGSLSDLQFNHSHADHLVACAFARGDPVGIDVESADREVDERIAGYFLSAAERSQFDRLAAEERRRFLLQRWTLKEAYAKARGLGLSLPFAQVTCCYDKPGAPHLALDAELADDPARWQMWQWLVEGEHWLALAWARGADVPVRVHVRRIVPPVEAWERDALAADARGTGC
ncbi:MAG: 4'-phosphopantetheinyl transferase superfamily protein [Pirellulaceae bacterium]|jgi:4'-phosphopantetheinyl transferase|nr:4'-phosphopantetheinyl transferase superfamily protein [Pirellulaceae bacterium]